MPLFPDRSDDFEKVTMDKSFEPGQIEPKWYAEWEARG